MSLPSKPHKIIASVLGGSHLYGLNTPESDEDVRFVFINDDYREIIGLNRHDHQNNTDPDESKPKAERKDEQGFELRHFLRMLRHSNTQCMELLFAPESSFQVIAPAFQLVRTFAARLVSTEGLYKSMSGYVKNELRLALGERTGKLGGKRKAMLDKYGFSPTNFSHIFRLCYAARVWFMRGQYPVRVADWNPMLAEYLLDLKQRPGNFRLEALKANAEREIHEMDLCYENRLTTTHYDEELANRICFVVYWPELHMARMRLQKQLMKDEDWKEIRSPYYEPDKD